MPKSLTLVLITQSHLARVDVARGRAVQAKNVWWRDRIPGESAATLAEAALMLGPKRTGEVWVLSADFWTGVVELSPEVAGSLDGSELEQAVALEAETDSGLSAFDSRVGVKRLPPSPTGERRWWVTQIPETDWRQIDAAVAQFGGKLKGMAHPALASVPDDDSLRREGVAAATGGDVGTQPWHLLQVFEEQTLGVTGIGSEIQDVIALGTLESRRNQSQLYDWFETSGLSPADRERLADWDRTQAAGWATEDLDSGGAVFWLTDRATPLQVAESGGGAIHLAESTAPMSVVTAQPLEEITAFQQLDVVQSDDDDSFDDDSFDDAPAMPERLRLKPLFGEAAFRIWAETIAGSLVVDRDGSVLALPVSVRAKEPLSNQAAAMISCALAVLAAAGCYGLYAATGSNLQSVNEQIDALKAEEKKVADAQKELEGLRARVAAHQSSLAALQERSRSLQANLETATQVRQFQRTRWLELLNAIAHSRQQDVWIQGMESDNKRVTLSGIAVREQDVADFTSELEVSAGQHGWRVHPARTDHNESALIEFAVPIDISDRVVLKPTDQANASAAEAAEAVNR